MGEVAGKRVVVSGASGLIGTALVTALRDAGQDVLRLVRRAAAADDEIAWDPAAGTIDGARLEGCDAVVNLAGRGIADGRWTAAVKRELIASRVDGARLIGKALAGLERPPRVWVNASAIGFYGDRGDEPLDEASAPGTGFLADTCRDWEAAVAAPSGVRVVLARFGVVLARDGGALAKMLPTFRLGLGGRLGSGRQQMSWIGLDDAVAALVHVLRDETVAGPVNVVAPDPVTNREFTATLGRVLGRPTWFAVPAAVVGLLFGEMGRETVLAGSRVLPRALERAGFEFRHPRLEDALRSALLR